MSSPRQNLSKGPGIIPAGEIPSATDRVGFNGPDGGEEVSLHRGRQDEDFMKDDRGREREERGKYARWEGGGRR